MHIAEAGERAAGAPAARLPGELVLLAASADRAGRRPAIHAVAPGPARLLRRPGRRAAADADVGEYTMLHLTGDVIALMDALGEEQAVVAGHDWGAPVAWHTALFRPDRIRGVIGLSVPYRPRGSRAADPGHARRASATSFYMVYFQEPGVADAELERDPPATFRQVLTSASGTGEPGPGRGGLPIVPPGGGFLDICPEPAALPSWLTEQRHRHLRGPVRGVRLHRPAELVPQPGPQLGADRRLAARAGAGARRSTWPGSRTWWSVPWRQGGHRPARRGRAAAARAGAAARLRALDPAGAAGRGQRGHDRVPARAGLTAGRADRRAGLTAGSGSSPGRADRRARLTAGRTPAGGTGFWAAAGPGDRG